MTDEDIGPASVDHAEDRAGPAVRRLADWNDDWLAGLVDQYGSPLYVIDLDRVRQNCERLLTAFPNADVRYAAKAHTGRAVLETVRSVGHSRDDDRRIEEDDGADRRIDIECASAGEVRRAIDAGFSGDRIHYTAVNPPGIDLDTVVDRWEKYPELTITAGATDTIDRLEDRGYDGRLCLRVNPGVGAGHHEKVETGAAAKFGVPIERALEVGKDAADRFEFVGIHAHAGSGISGEDLSEHRELVRRMGTLARALADEGVSIEFVDVGGGFGVPYREEEPPLDLTAVAEATRSALGEVSTPDGEPVELAIEPGRYVVADAGVLLTRINTIKTARDATVVGADAGMTTLLRPAMYDAYHPVRNVSRDGPATTVTIAGPICESADVLANDRKIAAPERGDVLAVGIAGAYGYEMASTYNSRPRPPEVAHDTGTVGRVRRGEQIADLTRLEVELTTTD